jgi:hypothetical protein
MIAIREAVAVDGDGTIWRSKRTISEEPQLWRLRVMESAGERAIGKGMEFQSKGSEETMREMEASGEQSADSPSVRIFHLPDALASRISHWDWFSPPAPRSRVQSALPDECRS